METENGLMKKPNTAIAIPTLTELVNESDERYKDNAFMVLLNQEPPKEWIKSHPFATTKNEQGKEVPVPYLPIQRVEYLLSRIFTKWWVEVRSSQVFANSVVVCVRVYVKNPVTGETDWNDGIGASPIQTNKGAGAMDWNEAKSAGVMMAAPSAETYAIKDAAEKFGKLFGKDLSRQNQINYTELLSRNAPIDYEELKELYDLKKSALSKDEQKNAERILTEKETASYRKLKNQLQAK